MTSTLPREWDAVAYPEVYGRVRLPSCISAPCAAKYEIGLHAWCTRTAGHSGRHAASHTGGVVVAVWGGDRA